MNSVAEVQKKITIFLLLLLQVLLSVAVGFGALYFTTLDTVPPEVYIGSLSVSGLKWSDVPGRLEDYYGEIIKNGSLTINFGSGDFAIKYSELDASMDYEATTDGLRSGKMGDMISSIVYGYFISTPREFHPVVTLNEGKLRDRLNELSTLVDTDPVNVNIRLEDEEIVKTPDIDGIRLDIDNAVVKVKAEISSSFDRAIEFELSNNFELKTLKAEYVIEDLEGIEEVISEYTTDIKVSGIEDYVRLAASAINKVLIYPLDKETNKEAGVFSFNKYLNLRDGIQERNNEGYNQVASTLHAAVLLSGIRQNTITRTPHKTQVDYIDPGLDVVLLGKTVDFKFKNTLEYPVVVFAEVSYGKVTVKLAGKKQDVEAKNSLKIEVEQRYDPPVINLECEDLLPGQKELLSPGREGLKISVYRVVTRDGVEVDKKYVHTDKYDALEAIMQVGPTNVVDKSEK